MNNNNKNHIAVVGAGIIGINCALKLQSLGFQVTLLDKEGIGAGCSQRNAGHFATEQVFPLAEISLLWQIPKFFLDPLSPIIFSPSYFPNALPWFLRFIANMPAKTRNQNTEALKSLNKDAIDYYKPLLKEAQAEQLLTTEGSLLVFEDSPISEVNKQWQQYHDAGISVELLNREQTLALEPNLNKSVTHSLYFTDVGHTANPKKICDCLATLATDKGAEFRKFSVCNITSEDNSVKVSDNNQTLIFDKLIISTGAWSKELLAQLGYKLPLEVERGYSLDLAIDIDKPSLTRPVASAERKFIMTPMDHGLRLSGTVEFAGLKQKPNYKRADILYQHAKKLINNVSNFDKKTITDNHRWFGFRASLPDSLPVICKAPRHDNIFCALGHQHLGLTQGAITGTLISQVISQQKTDIDISPFCLSRFH